MRKLSFFLPVGTAFIFSIVLYAQAGHCETDQIRVGKVIGGNGFQFRATLRLTKASTRPRAWMRSSLFSKDGRW